MNSIEYPSKQMLARKQLSASCDQSTTKGFSMDAGIIKSLSCDCLRKIEIMKDIEDLSINENKKNGFSNISLCTCQQSKKYPLCDKTHEKFNKETNSNLKPLVIKMKHSDNSDITEELGIKQRAPRKKSLKEDSIVNNLDPTEQAIPVETGNESNNSEIPNENSPLKEERKAPTIRKVDHKSVTAIYTREEVAKHNTKEDCWMIVKGKVYDVTPYFEFHPGGQRALMNYAGKDATENVQFHSSKMMSLLEKFFYVGKLHKEEDEASFCIIS